MVEIRKGDIWECCRLPAGVERPKPRIVLRVRDVPRGDTGLDTKITWTTSRKVALKYAADHEPCGTECWIGQFLEWADANRCICSSLFVPLVTEMN